MSKVYYVNSVTGNDGNPGTFASPWATVAHVNAVHAAGDTINLDGTFTDTIQPAHDGVTYRGMNGETPPHVAGGFWHTPSDITVDTIDFTGQLQAGADDPAQYCKRLHVSNLSFHSFDGIAFLVACEDLRVDTLYFRDIGGDAIYAIGDYHDYAHITGVNIGFGTTPTEAKHGIYCRATHTAHHDERWYKCHSSGISLRGDTNRVTDLFTSDCDFGISYFTQSANTGTTFIDGAVFDKTVTKDIFVDSGPGGTRTTTENFILTNITPSSGAGAGNDITTTGYKYG